MPGSRSSRTTRRVLQIVSLGLAGLLAGLLSGCSASNPRIAIAPNDTDWRTPSTYASAITSMPPRSAVRSGHLRLCGGATCAAPVYTTERISRMPHKAL